MITEYEHAEAIVADGDRLGMLGLARGMPYDPRWLWHAAVHLGARVKAPKQYLRSQPSRFRTLFERRAARHRRLELRHSGWSEAEYRNPS